MTASALPDTQWLRDLELITTAAMAAGEKALGFFRKNPDFRYKNEDRSPVSEADYAANDVLKERLLAARPNYGWLSEETDDDEARLGCETVFVVDPIDGTRAFIAGKDVWCVSVAVVHEGRPVAGVLYAPALIELYQAAQGQGRGATACRSAPARPAMATSCRSPCRSSAWRAFRPPFGRA